MSADRSGDLQLRSLLRHAPVGIVFLDPDFRFRAISDALAAANGRSVADHLGRTVAEVSPTLWATLEPTLVDVRDHGTTVSRTDSGRAVPAAGGRERHWQCTYFPMGDGPPYGVGAVIVEITDRRHLAQVTRFFMAVTDVLAQPSDELHSDLERIGRVFVPALADLCAIGIVDTGEVVLVHRDARTEAHLRGMAATLFPTGREQAILELLAGRPQVVHEVTREMVWTWVPDDERAAVVWEHGARSAVVAPLMVGSRLLGMLTLAFTAVSQRRYHEPDIPLAQELSVRLAQLLERARLTAESERARARLEMLAAVGELAGVELDLRARLDRLPALLVPAIADVCAVYLVQGDELRMEVFHHPDPLVRAAVEARPFEARRLDDETPAVRSVRTGEVVLVDPVTPVLHEAVARDEHERRIVDATSVRSLLCVPLEGDDGPFGALGLGFARSGRRYSDEDVALAREVARRVGAWMSDAIRYERERTNAEVLQHALLPERLPAPVTSDMTFRYVPGTSELQVGGDWYDSLVLPDGRVVVSIGDVVGHGVSAAADMGRLRNVIEMCVLEGLEPAQVLDQLNVAAHGISPPVMATAIVAVLDPVRGTAVFASAGHLPPVLRRLGRAQVLPTRAGPPVGAFIEPDYRQTEFDFGDACTLLLVTDGLVERRGVAIDERIEELASVFERCEGDLDVVADTLLHKLAGGQAPTDDVALLLVQRPDGSAVFDRRVPGDLGRLRALRGEFDAWLGSHDVEDDLRSEAVLAVNEVVVNAMEHGGTGVYVGARLRRDALTVEVRDGGRWRGAPRSRPGGLGVRGRGLMMVERLSRSCAIETGPRGTTVRFELAR